MASSAMSTPAHAPTALSVACLTCGDVWSASSVCSVVESMPKCGRKELSTTSSDSSSEASSSMESSRCSAAEERVHSKRKPKSSGHVPFGSACRATTETTDVICRRTTRSGSTVRRLSSTA